MKSQTTLATHEATRIAKRLTKHWEHKFATESDDNRYIIHMANDGVPTATVTLTPSDDSLVVLLDGANDNHERIQQVIIDHLARMGDNKELNGTWELLDE